MRKRLGMLVGCIFLLGKCLFVLAFVPLRCLRVDLRDLGFFLVQVKALVDRIMILISLQGFRVDFLIVQLGLLELLDVLLVDGLFLRHWNLYISG